MTISKPLSGLLGLTLLAAACGNGAATEDKDTSATLASQANTTVTESNGGDANSPTTAPPDTSTGGPDDRAGTVGTREVPIALGELASIGDWLVNVVSVVPDATDRLLEENEFLEEPEDGNQFFLIELEGTYVGEGSASLWSGFFYHAVGASNVAYDEFDADCGFIEGQLSAQGEAFAGGTVRGYQCFEVAVADAADLRLFVEPGASFGDDRTFFALVDGVGVASGVEAPTGPEVDTGGDVGTRTNPVAMDSAGSIGDWYITVRSVDLDATGRVLAENDFNSAPEDGFQYVLADVELSYAGPDSATFWSDLSWSAVGASNVAVDTFDASCGLIANEVTASREVFANGTMAGALCVALAADDVATAVLFFDGFGEGRQFFAIRPGDGSETGLSVPSVDVDHSAEVGARGNPIGRGSTASVADWDIVVANVDADATDAVLAESSFNEPPSDGNVFVLIDLEVSYTGGSSSTFWSDTSWSILGASNVAFSPYDVSCGSIPNDLTFADEVFAGGTVTGAVCFEVAADEVNDLLLIIDDFSTFENEGRVFLDL